jgi:hypothetical protein
MYFKFIVYDSVDGLHLTQNEIQQRAFVNVVMNIRFIKEGEFLSQLFVYKLLTKASD